jgi:hypothetical protein
LASRLTRPGVVVKPLGEERLQIKTYLALRAYESLWMLNEFARAFLHKCSPPSDSGAHVVGAKMRESVAPDGIWPVSFSRCAPRFELLWLMRFAPASPCNESTALPVFLSRELF